MNRPHIFRAIFWCVLAIGIAAGGCTKQSVGSGGGDVAGSYVLVSVDGQDLPATVSHGDVSIRVLSGTFIIDAGGGCSSSTVFVPPTGDEIERTVAATYTREGAVLTMSWQGAGMTTGTVAGDTFTMDNEGMAFVYRR